MSGTQLLILSGILLLSFSVLAIVSPKAFRLALHLLINGIFGILALSILSMLWSSFSIGINLWSVLISTLLGLPGVLLLLFISLFF